MNNMTPSENLRLKIAELKARKEIQEEALNASMKELTASISPMSVAMNGLQILAQDRNIQSTATGTALKFGTRFLALKVGKRYGGVFGAVAGVLVTVLSDKENSPKMLNLVGNLFKKKKKKVPIEIAEIEEQV